MANRLNVSDVRIDRREVRDARKGTIDQIEATIKVENASERETLYVSVSLRYVAFDEARRELTLSTAEPENLLGEVTHFILPTIVAVEPGGTLPVRLEVAVRFAQITGVKDRRLVTEAVDLSSVGRVKAQIGFGTTAFRPIPKQTAKDLRRQLLEWQHVVENTFDRSLPGGGGEAKPTKSDSQAD